MTYQLPGLLWLLIHLLLQPTFASPLSPGTESTSVFQPTFNLTSIALIPSPHFQPTCSSAKPAYHPITREACSEGLKYLIDNRPETRRRFVHQSRPYNFPPQPAPGSTCEITVFTRLPGHEAVFDYYDVYVDAQAVIDECEMKPGASSGPSTGRVQMLERGRWNGFWVEVSGGKMLQEE